MLTKLNNFKIDITEMLRGLAEWIRCESPTFSPAAVNRVQDIAVEELANMGTKIERLTINEEIGDCVLAHFPHPNRERPGILIMGHMDTVHPIGTITKLPFKQDGKFCYGPGICDMKGGDYIALKALRQIQKLNLKLRCRFQFYLPQTRK